MGIQPIEQDAHAAAIAITHPEGGSHITKDAVYNTVEATDFPAMLDVGRYGERTTAFDKIISQTHHHFWDPLDTKYIDFNVPFDIQKEYIMPPGYNAFLVTKMGKALPEEMRISIANETTRFHVSSILHGEAGALALSASLCHILRDPGAQEYAANQTREEARHVTAFTQYIKARWGTPLDCGPTLKDLLKELVDAPEVYKKLVGMQMLIEGLAMGAFATFYQHANDPLLRQTCQLVMTDEAFHHKFGKIWADRTIPKLNPAEHEVVEAWAANCFQTLLFNLISADQMKSVYERHGLDPDAVIGAIAETATDSQRRSDMKESTNIFRVLAKTLLTTGIITDRTRGFYAMYLDMDGLKAEGDRMIGDDIAEEGIRYLQRVNFTPKSSVAVAAM